MEGQQNEGDFPFFWTEVAVFSSLLTTFALAKSRFGDSIKSGVEFTLRFGATLLFYFAFNEKYEIRA